MSTPAVAASGLVRRFGATVAVDDLSLEVPQGALFGLLGPDGAGKSTLLRLLATVLLPDAGDATVFGRSVTRESAHVTRRIGYMSQQFCLYPDLSVAENIAFFATVRGVDRATRRRRSADLLGAMGLADVTARQAGRLSGGMKQKLMLATTLMHAPDLVLLDEPTTGVDPVARREFWGILAGLRDAGTTVVVATPAMDEAERCSHVAFMAGGRVTHAGTPAEIKALVPGLVLEVHGPDADGPAPHTLLEVLTRAPGVTSAHLLGDAVRLLVDAGAPRASGRGPALALAAWLSARGIAADVRRIDPDMETAFAHLAEAS